MTINVTYWAHRLENRTPKGNFNFNNIFEDERALRMCGYKPSEYEKVSVKENPKGEYLGWVATGHNFPSMITLDRLFEINFPNGHKAEEQRGRGVAVRLDVKPV